MKDEINEKKIQMHVLEQKIMGSLEESDLSSSIEMSQVLVLSPHMSVEKIFMFHKSDYSFLTTF
jgi:hypothetical protein